MGLLDKFLQKLIRATPVHRAPATSMDAPLHHRSRHGTKAQRRIRRKIAHESRRVNFQKGA